MTTGETKAKCPICQREVTLEGEGDDYKQYVCCRCRISIVISPLEDDCQCEEE